MRIRLSALSARFCSRQHVQPHTALLPDYGEAIRLCRHGEFNRSKLLMMESMLEDVEGSRPDNKIQSSQIPHGRRQLTREYLGSVYVL
jgi:hypothetical protein